MPIDSVREAVQSFACEPLSKIQHNSKPGKNSGIVADHSLKLCPLLLVKYTGKLTTKNRMIIIESHLQSGFGCIESTFHALYSATNNRNISVEPGKRPADKLKTGIWIHCTPHLTEAEVPAGLVAPDTWPESIRCSHDFPREIWISQKGPSNRNKI